MIAASAMWKLVAATVLAKALLMSLVTAAILNDFLQSLILVLVSATATGVFGLAITWIQLRENRQLHETIGRLEGRQVDIAGAVGAAKRHDDPPASDLNA